MCPTPPEVTGPVVPDLTTEIALAQRCAQASGGGVREVVIAGLDEVGRGALAGPVVVGACAIRIRGGVVLDDLPDRVRDSKLLTPRRRDALVAPIMRTAWATGLGWASAAEIDARGIMGALTLAAIRALDALGSPVDGVLLDGNADLITEHLSFDADGQLPQVHVQVAADRTCRSVAAASILAKEARDAHMIHLAQDVPHYGWSSNKGYGAAAHREALTRYGAHREHRRSWNLGLDVTAPRRDHPVADVPVPDLGRDDDATVELPAVLWRDDPTAPIQVVRDRGSRGVGTTDGDGTQEDAR